MIPLSVGMAWSTLASKHDTTLQDIFELKAGIAFFTVTFDTTGQDGLLLLVAGTKEEVDGNGTTEGDKLESQTHGIATDISGPVRGRVDLSRQNARDVGNGGSKRYTNTSFVVRSQVARHPGEHQAVEREDSHRTQEHPKISSPDVGCAQCNRIADQHGDWNHEQKQRSFVKSVRCPGNDPNRDRGEYIDRNGEIVRLYRGIAVVVKKSVFVLSLS